jgi:hypothetical protein
MITFACELDDDIDDEQFAGELNAFLQAADSISRLA